MTRKIRILLAALLIPFAVTAQDVQLRPDYPAQYIVVKGDTLWDIAGRFLTKPWQWPEIWQVNPQIKDPHWIYPGDVLTLTWRDGRPMLSLARGREVKLSPSVRAQSRADAIQPIPLDAIQQFLTRPLVLEENVIDGLPYVVASQDEHLVSGTGNRVYIRGLDQPTTSKYSIYRKGEAYRDPDQGGTIIGYEALHVGDAVLERLGDPATAVVVKSFREVLNGDRLLPQTEDVYVEFVPQSPAQPVDGSIISVIDGVSQIGQFQVVALNVGARDGVQPGVVLAIYQAGKVVTDRVGGQLAAERQAESDANRAVGGPIGAARMKVTLPEERAGELMVFRSFDDISYGLVMNTQRPVHELDRVRNP